MKIILLQVFLIVLVLAISWRLLTGGGQRIQAVRRLGLGAFATFAVLSILFPNVWTRIAHLVGVGRGTDLILYGLVIAFFSFVVTTYRRLRQVELRYTRLARRLALDEALRDDPRPPGSVPTDADGA
ncbi:DUF2304 domain-containing protein [Knoellia sp. Soil729]|uniref:DUF2304 domain-containing protein n=1 Tax=Knoellia sp. Soil729 TaxID=1736394 RepID=UPI0006FB7E21|nr:DUF2304 domain-containing protein [Knoellia sp. Soil729]KRE43724.1 hypothetical protein ASG74_02470 [Knoellia sp. Soil729]